MEDVPPVALNTEQFIDDIHSNPAIWDMRCKEYSDKIKRSEAWREVARKCYADFNSMEPAKQGAIVKDLNKKWKNLRQCYKRERDSQSQKSGAANKKKSQYVYFEILSFLAPVFNTKTTHSNIVDVEDLEEEEEGEKEEVLPTSEESGTEKTNRAPSKRKRDIENPVADVCQLLKRSLEERMAAEKRKGEREEVDGDYNFLMSLLNYTRAVQGLNKLAMRSELLQVVTKYYNMSVHPQHYLPQSYQQPPIQQAMHTNFSSPQYSSFPAPYPTSHSTSYSPPFPTPTVSSPHPSSAHSSHSTAASLAMSPLPPDLEFSNESSNF